MTPKAASQGANTTKAAALAAPQVTGIESRTLPLSSFTTILLTLASFIISFTFPTNPSPDTLYTSLLSPTCVPQFGQNLASGGTSDLQTVQFNFPSCVVLPELEIAISSSAPTTPTLS